MVIRAAGPEPAVRSDGSSELHSKTYASNSVQISAPLSARLIADAQFLDEMPRIAPILVSKITHNNRRPGKYSYTPVQSIDTELNKPAFLRPILFPFRRNVGNDVDLHEVFGPREA